MIPQKAIKKIKNDVHREIVAGHLIAYGFFPQTTEGIDQAKKFVAGLDQWLAPSDLPNYYDGLESDLMTGRETAGIRNIKMLMEQFYFGGGAEASQEPEEIPVEVEIVEVEQQQPDEPIVVKIEAPFENPSNPRVPRRIRLPRIRNTIPKSKVSPQQKKDTATRMADAFDSRLEDLLDAVRNPTDSSPPRTRKPKEVLEKRTAKIKSTFKEKKTPGFFQNSSLFLFNKTRNAFGRAAETRRIAKERGLPEQEKGFYFKKALGFEFGGDAIARTRGTFSKSPDATLDPSLTKQERFTEGLFGTRTIRPPQRQSTDDTDAQVDKLAKKIAAIDSKFKDVLDAKRSSPNSDAETATLEKTLEELKNALKKGNTHQKGINDSKKKLLDLEAKAADQAQAAAEEADIEQKQDLSNFEDDLKKEEVAKGEEKKGGVLDWLKNVKWGKWLQRLKNPGRTAKALYRLGRQKLKRNPLVRAASRLIPETTQRIGGFLSNQKDRAGQFIGNQKKNIMEGLDVLKNKGGQVLDFAKSKGDDLLRAGKGQVDNVMKIGAGLMDNVGGFFQKRGAQIATKVGIATGKFGGRMIPIAGTAASAVDAADRASRGDAVGAWLAGLGGGAGAVATATSPAAATGAGAAVPAVAEATSIVADVGLLGYDIFNALIGKEFKKKGDPDPTKLSEGGVNAMIGEAGPEMLIRSGEDSGVNPLQSLAPIIVAVREVTKRAGTWADPVENMVSQITDPIAKSLNLPTVPMSMEIGGDIQAKRETSPTKDIGKFISLLFGGKDSVFNFFKGNGSSDTPPAPTPPPGGGGTGQWGPLLNLIASKESGGNYEAMYPSTTLPGATSMTISEVARRATGAVGKYQQLPEYLVGRAKAAGLNPDTDLYSPANQDLIAGKVNIGINRGGDKWLKGQITDEQLMQNLSMEFAALPNAQGQFYYPGQRSSITPEQVKGALAQVRSTPASTPGATPANDAPVIPVPPAAAAPPAPPPAASKPPAAKPQRPAAPATPAPKPPPAKAPTAISMLNLPGANAPQQFVASVAAAAASNPAPIFDWNKQMRSQRLGGS